MAIEPVKRTWFLVDRDQLGAFVGALARTRSTHVDELDAADAAGETLELIQLAAETSDAAANADDRATKLARVLDVIDAFVPPKRAFHENFVNLPAEMRRDEFARAVESVDVEPLHDEATALQRDHARATRQADERRARIAELESWTGAPLPPAGLRRCGADLGTVPVNAADDLQADADARADLACDVVATRKDVALVAAAWLAAPLATRQGGPEADAAPPSSEEPAPRELLERHGFASLELEPTAADAAPDAARTVGDVVDRLRRELADAETERAGIGERAGALAERRRAVLAALAYWQAEVDRHRASARGVASNRIAVLTGYVRVRDLDTVETLIARDFPSVGLVTADPTGDEDVPVSLGGSPFFAPGQFLTSMFGLPDYFGFDPSPYIFFVFVLFFGFCFGDVFYGAMLLGLCAWLSGKVKREPGLRKMLHLFAWCGGSAMFFGVLTGSWLSDLFSEEYLGTGPVASALSTMRNELAALDLMSKPMIGLCVAIGIGVITQFYGIALRTYREARKRDYVAAVCDGGLWLVYLPSLLLLGAGLGGLLPGIVTRIAIVTAVASAVGLVLTQGRHEEGVIGKAATGVVSLYGILGSYGTTSFLSDTLSYSRLLALGLSTAVVGMVANFLGNLLGSMLPVWLGVVVFVLIAVVGHLFNFALSMLGGFVHSVRLVFLEFFSRFYEGGARPFAPLGEPQTVRVIDAD
jgi:hypothetical protein